MTLRSPHMARSFVCDWLLFSFAVYLSLASIGFCETAIQFSDVTSQTGIDFRHTDGSCGKYYIVEAMSAGLALFDYDNDGDVDIYLLNGTALCDSDLPAPTNALYRNDGNWRFTDVTKQAKIGGRGYSLGVAIGDYDNDGNPDVYVNNFGENVLYRNRGDGTFEDVTKSAGVANGNRVGAGVSFLDIDADGDLDLYAANYIEFSRNKHVPRTQRGVPIYGSPIDYTFDADTLFRNNGDGTFTDISEQSGISVKASPSMGMVCADYDSDGDTDIFIANDGQANFLFQNNGAGKFREVGLIGGFAYDMNGKVHASMGVDCADFDNDGHLDFHVTSFQGELASLYRNVSGLLLEDATNRLQAGLGTRLPVTWGNGFADFDNDGDRDIFIACGHLNDKLDLYDKTSTYLTPNVVLEQRNGRFLDVSKHAGNGLAVRSSSRGAAFDDLDNDGDIDVVILNSRQAPTLLRNDSTTKKHWIQVQLIGTKANRDAVGSRVTVSAANGNQTAEVHSGRGYQSHFGSRLHFGLGNHQRADQIRIQWLGGDVDVLNNVHSGQIITIREGSTKK